MIKRWFITGTDTGIGKTIASCALLQAANKNGYYTAGYKPVASGGVTTTAGIRNSDALALQANSNQKLAYSQVNPLIFIEATSPHIACELEKRTIELTELSQGLRQLENKANWLVIEGAGGWFTPLSTQITFADWVKQEALPVILVIGIKLGAINHALLTAQAIKIAGLNLVGWIANHIDHTTKRQQEYLSTLITLLPAPLIGIIPYFISIDQQITGEYLNIHLLDF
ncbi:dethiobiotin synthase [Candidatus Fukatsuia anoeciicola]|uniref:dethiobiotin synthase n=1 Tax=Candidatus Fukatsuia anoeciicola TaxID=2994492 RepID=UPI0034645751